MCVRSCFWQFANWLKHILQCLHKYGFSLVWVRSCCWQCANWLTHLSQCLHVYGFSPVWVRSCCLQADNRLKNWPQCLHSCAFSGIFVAISVVVGYDWLKNYAAFCRKTCIPSVTYPDVGLDLLLRSSVNSSVTVDVCTVFLTKWQRKYHIRFVT